MESEHRKLIEDNLHKLTQLTVCNVSFLAKLAENHILSQEDQQDIEAKSGEIKKASKLYRILLTREGAFTALLDALEETKQTGALKILKSLPEATTPKKKKISRFLRAPQFLVEYITNKRTYALVIQSDDCQLTLDRISETVPNANFLEPKTFLEVISDNEIGSHNSNSLLVIDCRNGFESCLLFENATKIRQHCVLICQGVQDIPNNYSTPNRKDILTWSDFTPFFQSQIEKKCLDLIGIHLKELHDIQKSLSHDVLVSLANGQSPLMFNDHLPEQISYYINRSLVTRSILSDNFFAHNGRDIFFIHGIERHELSKRVNGKRTDTSNDVLDLAISSNFVVLEDEHHFEIISKRHNDIPMHYILHRDSQFIWQRSTGALHTIQQYVHSSQATINEEYLLADMNQNQTIGISDAPGMGKTILLANIARKLKVTAKPWQNFFTVISEVFNKYLEFKNINDLEERVIKSFESCLCATELGKAVFSRNKLNIKDIFLDGLDELTAESIVDGYEFLSIIRKTFNNSRIWVTTRPHMSLALEKYLNILVYNIEPFSQENQISFLKLFWSRNSSSPESAPKYEIFANICLESLKSTINSNNEHDIAGIPLQCLLIGEVFEDEANVFVRSRENKARCIKIASISELYEELVEKKISKYFERYDKRNITNLDIMKAHIDLSLLLLFPSFRKKNGKLFSSHGVSVQEIFNVGLLESKSVLPVPRFIHRTFAEYFVAKFVKYSLEANNIDFIFELLFKQIFKTLKAVLKNHKMKFETRQFKHSVICFFLDCFIGKYELAINWNATSKKLYEKLVQKMIEQTADACVYSSFENILLEVVCKLPHFSGFAANVFNDRFIFICTLNSKRSMLEKVLDRFMSLNVSHTLLSNLSLQDCTLLHVAAARGNYGIFERIANLDGFPSLLSDKNDFIMNIVYNCITHSQTQNKQTINEKVNIVHYLSCVNQTWLKEIDVSSLISKQSRKIHIILLIELLQLAEPVRILGILQNFLHNATKKCSSEEYLKLLVYVKTKYSSISCSRLFNSSTGGFKLLERILMDIKIDHSMLQFILHSEFNIFYEEEIMNNPILIAIRNHEEMSTMQCQLPPNLVHQFFDLCYTELSKHLPSKDGCVHFDKLKSETSSVENAFTKWSWLVKFTQLKTPTFEELAATCVNEIPDINAQSNVGNTLMHVAAQNLNIRGVMFLYRLGGSVTLKNRIGRSPLDTAADEVKKEEWQNIFKEEGAISREEGLEHYIFYACKSGNLKGVKFFCEWYANLVGSPVASIKTENGGKMCTILDVVRQCEDIGIIEFVVTNHAFIEAYRASKQTSILFDCVKIDCWHDRDAEKSLKQIIKLHGDTVNSPDENGIVPLSTKGIHYKSVKLLVEVGANVNFVDSEGNTPLHWALKHGHFDVYYVVIGLIICGADVNAENVDRETPLLLALNLNFSFDTLRCVEALVNGGADVRRRDSFGDTFLHILPSKLKSDQYFSKEKKFHGILECVLRKGHSGALSILGKDNLTPIQVASQHFELLPETLQILKKYDITI